MKKLTKKIIGIMLCLTLLLGTASFSAACGHTHVEGEIEKENVIPATCTVDGSYTEIVRCKDCKEIMSRTEKTEPALGHMPSSPVKENVSGYPCVDGKYTYDEVIYCADCETEISRVQKSVESSDHTPGEEVKENEKAPTCFAKGSYDTVVYCKGCKAELSRDHHDIDMTEHDFDDTTYAKDKTGHWHPCKTSGCTEKSGFEEHTPGAPATETTSQTCTECGYVLASPVGHVHADHLAKVDAKAASCTEDGNIEYYSCSCGNWYEDAAATKLIDNHADALLSATGHSFAKDYTSDDTHHWHAATCAHTDEKDGYAEHTFDDGVISNGKKTYTCSVCKKTREAAVHAVTLEYNYTGAPEAKVVYVEDGATLVSPSGFGRENYKVSGWYTDAACTNAYDLSDGITTAITLYPKWEIAYLSERVIEAEYINLTGISGVGYSNETMGTGLIQKDENGANASNGYFLGYLYRRGLVLTFKINSDEATENAMIKLSLGAEYKDYITLTCDEFTVKVNGEKMSFETMNIKGNSGVGFPSEFNDFTVGVGVNLVKGENVITLTVSNSRTMEAAMRATAPLIDCMKIYSDTEITYTPKTDNLDRFN